MRRQMGRLGQVHLRLVAVEAGAVEVCVLVLDEAYDGFELVR